MEKNNKDILMSMLYTINDECDRMMKLETTDRAGYYALQSMVMSIIGSLHIGDMALLKQAQLNSDFTKSVLEELKKYNKGISNE